MKKILSIFLILVACLTCEPKLKPEKPHDLIERDKMVNVLYDMFVVSSAKGVSRIKFKENGVNPEQFILRKHNIDSIQFATSNDYYAHDIEVYKNIIDEIKARLSKEKEKYLAIDKKEDEEEKRIKDSILKVRQVQKANPSLNKIKPYKKKKISAKN